MRLHPNTPLSSLRSSLRSSLAGTWPERITRTPHSPARCLLAFGRAAVTLRNNEHVFRVTRPVCVPASSALIKIKASSVSLVTRQNSALFQMSHSDVNRLTADRPLQRFHLQGPFEDVFSLKRNLICSLLF